MATQHWFTWAVAASLACGSAVAQERARVLSTVPVVQQVAVPQQFCEDVQVDSGQRSNGTGALIGALIGGVAGHSLGRSGAHYSPRGYGHRGYGHHGGYSQGPSRGAATVVGAIAGGLIGNVIESSTSQPTYDTVRKCTNETVYENRTVAYDVSYAYAGQRYHTRLDYDPGAWMPVEVQPRGQDSAPYGERDHTRFVGPSGAYQPAPAGMVVTDSFSDAQLHPSMAVDGGYPAPQWQRPPPPPSHGWR